MRISFKNAIDRYLKECQTTDWIDIETYKFQFASYVKKHVNWAVQSDEEITKILKQSQKIKYAQTHGNGVQFIIKSAKDLKSPIHIKDVKNFRKVYEGMLIKDIDWTQSGMSFTGLSAWLAALFPDKVYPVPMKGFNKTIHLLFGERDNDMPKVGLKYILNCQPYLEQTERILKLYPIQEMHLKKWNKYSLEMPHLGIVPKTHLSQSEWVWLVQDFHLFVLRKIIDIEESKEELIEVDKVLGETALEGNQKMKTHLVHERNSSFIKKIKENAIKENIFLCCDVCGFSFLDTYGKLGKGFIEAHHIKPLSERDGERKTTKEDIALVCSNCHRMLHRQVNDRLLSIDELKGIIDDSING